MKSKSLMLGIALSALATLTSCGGGGGNPNAQVFPPTAVAPPPPAQMGLSLAPCLSQVVANGRSLQSILIPDVLVLDLSQPSGFPNGRDFDDPVIDLELNAFFLNLSRNPVTTLAGVPVNPNNFDQPLRTVFPFYAPPLGTPTLSPSTGSNFNFRTEAITAFNRVDRMGLPAVATATIVPLDRKNAYNDGSPTLDASGTFVNDILAGYQALTNALNDDFRGLGLTPCAT